MRAARWILPSPVRAVQGEGEKRWTWRHKAYFALSAASFLQSERNFLRSLPCSPLASASLEHSRDAAVCGLAAILSAAAGAAVSLLAAGAVAVCARAGPANSSRDAKAVAAAREEIVIMVAPVRL